MAARACLPTASPWPSTCAPPPRRHFRELTRTPVPFLYRSRDAELYAERPLIQLTAAGAVAAVHYNSRSIAPVNLPAAAGAAVLRRLPAFRRADARAALPAAHAAGSGTLVVFDNQRILHGRTAFASAQYPRHLRGCYLTRDSVYSEAALLRRELAQGGSRA